MEMKIGLSAYPISAQAPCTKSGGNSSKICYSKGLACDTLSFKGDKPKKPKITKEFYHIKKGEGKINSLISLSEYYGSREDFTSKNGPKFCIYYDSDGKYLHTNIYAKSEVLQEEKYRLPKLDKEDKNVHYLENDSHYSKYETHEFEDGTACNVFYDLEGNMDNIEAYIRTLEDAA